MIFLNVVNVWTSIEILLFQLVKMISQAHNVPFFVPFFRRSTQ